MEWGTTNVKEEAELRPAYIQSKEVYRRRDFVLGKPVFWKAPLRHTAKLLSADTVITMIVGILVIVVFSIFFLRVVLANVSVHVCPYMPDDGVELYIYLDCYTTILLSLL